jgi:DNA polymerase V
VRELNGESCMSLEEAPPTKQQIVCSRSFGEKITEYDSLRQAVCQYAERASEKLRKERQYCRHISVFIKTSPFAVKEPYYGNVATEKLLTPTQDTRDIIAAATAALERIWKDGHRYAKAGVMLNDFTSSGVSQLQLFDERPPRPHSAELMKVLDGINHSGLGQVWFAGRGFAPSWQMKRDMLSPAYHPLERYPHSEDRLNFAFQRASSARRSRTTGRSPRVSERTRELRINSAYARC